MWIVKMKILVSFFIFCFSLFAYEISPGQMLPMSVQNLNTNKPVEFLGHQVLPFPSPANKTSFLLFLAVDYKTKVGDYNLTYFQGEKQVIQKIAIVPKKYKEEILHVEPQKVHPPKKFEDEIYKEYKQALQIYTTNTKEVYWKKPFIFPLHSPITSDFGNARVYNGSLNGYHSGTDFKAKMATPIKASNDGVVVLAQKRYYAGGSVIIDHGYGVYSCYYHLSKIEVQVGEKISQGQLIGLSGKSGRVTGPHLHFGMRVANTNVDPVEFINKTNALFLTH